LRPVAIVTDSTADLPSEYLDSHGISSVPLIVTYQHKEYLDGIDITASELYRRMKEEKAVFTTSQPSVGAFEEVYRALLKDSEQILSIHISSGLSGTVAAAESAAENVGRDRIIVYDSKGTSAFLGILVQVAAALIEQGATVAEAIEHLDRIRQSMQGIFTLPTLEYLSRGGRIGAASAFLGSVLQVKPVLALDREGKIVPLERIRTFSRAVSRLEEIVKATADVHGEVYAGVAHADAEQTALGIASAIHKLCKSVSIVQIGPVVGSHMGPGSVGICFVPAASVPIELELVNQLSFAT
jgi:DegV family protein with EDD domain